MVLVLPFFSYWILTTNKEKLREEEFYSRFSSLYNDVRIKSKLVAPLCYITFFCTRRLSIASTIVFCDQLIFIQTLTYSVSSLCTLKYLHCSQPKEKRILNNLETFNETMIVMTSYFMLTWSNFVDDVEMRYQIGKVFLKCVVVVVTINFAVILYQMGTAVFRIWQKIKFKKKWNSYLKIKERLIQIGHSNII